MWHMSKALLGRPECVSQRDLRMRSKEIMDALETGQTFTVTRDGREIGTLAPSSHRRTFVPADEFFDLMHGLPPIDAQRFWADVDATFDDSLRDPYDRSA